MISVLYIDDSPGLIREMKQFLERSGNFSVDGAGSGTNVLSHYPFSGYDIIIAAHELGEMNGNEITRIIRGYSQTIPFILITNTPVSHLKDEDALAGPDYIIQRQGSLFRFYDDLSLKISRLVKRKQRERKIRDRRLALKIDANPFQEGNLVITSEGKILYGGYEIALVLAISIDDLRKNGLFTYMDEKERSQFLFALEKSREAPIKKFEFELIGTDVHIRSMMSMEVWLNQDEINGDIFVFREISEVTRLKNAARTLQKIDQICNILLSTMNGVSWIINTVSMTYTFVSSSCYQFLGYPAQDLALRDINRADIIITSRPISDIIWERAIIQLSIDNPPGLFSDRLTLIHRNGISIMTEVTSEFFTSEEMDVLMVRGFTREIDDVISINSERNLSDSHLILRGKIGLFLDAIYDTISSLKSESEDINHSNLLEKVDLLRFALRHHATWDWAATQKIDLHVSDLSGKIF